MRRHQCPRGIVAGVSFPFSSLSFSFSFFSFLVPPVSVTVISGPVPVCGLFEMFSVNGHSLEWALGGLRFRDLRFLVGVLVWHGVFEYVFFLLLLWGFCLLELCGCQIC